MSVERKQIELEILIYEKEKITQVLRMTNFLANYISIFKVFKGMLAVQH